MQEDDIPPQWMWSVGHELEIWFDRLDQEREDKQGGGGGDTSAPMMQNDLANGRR